jgi:hypothetical protein
MPGLMCVIDGVDRNNLRHTINYLQKKFIDDEVRIVTYDNSDDDYIYSADISQMLSIVTTIKPDIILTNHLISVPHLKKFNTIVWLTDRMGNACAKRTENVGFWRQTMGLLKTADQQIYAASQFTARKMIENYRIPCKLLYPYIPTGDENSSEVVLFNDIPRYLNKLKEHFPDQPFEKLVDFSDLKKAKLYVHISVGMEYTNIEIPLAHSYGVPCVIENTGCLSEYATPGDILVPLGGDERTWIQTFKQSLRDRDINSETVKKLSFRYSHMSEIEQRIKAALQKNKPMRPPSFQEAQSIARRKHGGETLRPITNKPEKKQPVRPVVIGNGLPKNDVDHVKEYLSSNENVYFGCGGLGDAMLTISMCYKDPNAKVIFGANHPSVQYLFDAFKIPVMITRNFFPSVLGMTLHHYIITHANCKGGGHIPDTMNFGEWSSDNHKYLSRINKSMPLLDIFGKLVNPRATKGVIGICPRGSDHNNLAKQRFLTTDEFRRLVSKFIEKDLTVFAFGSVNDVEHYGSIQHNNFIWMTSEFGISHPAPRYPTSFRHLLSCINSCDELYSVDTWLKTYSALAGIPTKVILSRRHGVTMIPPADASDYIFMDREFWGFDFVDIHSLLK